MGEISGHKIKALIGDILSYLVLILTMFIGIFPLFWGLLSSFKSPGDIMTYPPEIIFEPTLMNYRFVLSQGVFEPIFNTIAVTLGTILLVIIVACPAGYAIARFQNKLTKSLGVMIFSIRFLPIVSFILPLFLILRQLGLLGSIMGLIISYQVFALPIVLWLMWSFFSQIPEEIYDSAKIDGCGDLGMFIRIAMPIAAPGLAAAVVLVAIFSWNQFLIPLVIAGRQPEVVTLVISDYLGGEGIGIRWGPMTAWAIIISGPVILFGFATFKYLIRGLTGGQN